MPARSAWDEWVHQRNLGVAASGRRREVRDLDGGRPETAVSADGRAVLSFASNDYLGLSQHPTVIEASRSATAALGTGAGSARLIVGARPVHRQLEDDLAAWKGTEAALLFSTGFAANLGVLATLGADPETLIVSDELNHASIIDGARLARAQVAVAVHGDVDHVASLLDGHPGRAIVVTDSVFSMDGDLAPVDDLAAVCADRGALLVLDEAHAVLGPPTPSLPGLDVVVVGTLSKTLGSLGGFMAAPRSYVELLTSTARSFIFTTATPPGDAAAAAAALAVVRSSEGDELRARLRAHIDRLRPGHPSPIVPVLLGDEERALAVADALLERGLLVPAIRPPTVAPGTCRLRIALSAAHTAEQVDSLVTALDELRCAPVRLVVVAGTGTEVGKTWFTARVIEHLRAGGRSVGARKPAQSYDPDDPHPTDATVLAEATGEDVSAVCSDRLSFPIVLAPPMAAEALGHSVPTLADLAAACGWPDPAPDVGFVELAGGVRSPMAADGDGVALTDLLGADRILLVADAGLGTINAVRLTLVALGPARPVLVVLNRYNPDNPLHERNRSWLVDRDSLEVVTSPAAAADWLLA